MLSAKYGFVQSMDCAAQTMDPYFVRAIHELHVRLNFFVFILIYLNCFSSFFKSVYMHGLHKPAS